MFGFGWKIPTRLVIGLLIFTNAFITYMMRVNMSINLISMVDQDPEKSSKSFECHGNSSQNSGDIRPTPIPNYGTRYAWDTKLQGLILGSYFWGSILSCIPGGLLAEKFGPTKTILTSTLIAGTLTILAPLMASWSVISLIFTRFLTGLCSGVIFPSFQCLISHWAPPEEKTKFIGTLLGGTFGTVITWPLLGTIIEYLGWIWSFYINGALVFISCIIWVLCVTDFPEIHPRISVEEKDYIMKSMGNNLNKSSGLPPYKNIFTSIPFWALACLHFGNCWGMFFLLTAGPNFMSNVLGFNLGHSGLLAALPYLARLLFGFGFSFIGDYARTQKFLTITTLRKFFVIFSQIIPGLLLLVLLITGCNVIWAIVILTLSLGFNGASIITNLQNTQDLAPNYAGSIYGIINCIGSTSGFLSPMLTGYLTSEKNGMNEWHMNFIISSTIYITTGIIFLIWGSAQLQPWNDTKSNKNSGIDNPVFVSDSQKNQS